MLELKYALSKVQKPARYVGGEVNSVVKNRADVRLRFAFCFPDLYEIGMSHLGMKILYGVLNNESDIWCERVFAPAADMEGEMRARGIPLFGIESRDPVREFDLVGFTLQTELCYTNVVNMLDLAQITLYACERREDEPFVCAGGPVAYNAEPVADFFDFFMLGEGEEVILEVSHLVRDERAKGTARSEILWKLAQIEGIYVPGFYDVSYRGDGTVEAVSPNRPGVPERVRKRIVQDLDRMYYPEYFVVPFCDIVHDRAMVEVFRGCIRGCRFCQAGNIYRPIREKSVETLNENAKRLIASTGYEEISLSSLSTSDYPQLERLADTLLDWCEADKVSLSLPSLRVDNFSTELMQRVQRVRKGALTFAPEAGSQRMRDVINKNVTEQQLLKTVSIAFAGGWSGVKLYFMIGLPGETMEDVLGITELAKKVLDVYYATENRARGRGAVVTASVAGFVPKPFTPFQWAAQDTVEQFVGKQQALRESVRTKKISLHWHESKVSFLEAVFARGDRRLSKVILEAWRRGAKFDEWDDSFRFETWLSVFEDCGLDPAFYANRERPFDEVLPWDHIDIGVSKAHLIREAKRAAAAEPSPNCREQCLGCGAAALNGGCCVGIG